MLTLRLPPLRERGQDVLLLAERFLARVCADYGLPVKTLAADARRRLMAYLWPGNVRELSNVIERVALLTEENVITSDHLGLGDGSPAPGPAAAAGAGGPAPAPLSLGDAMRAHLRATLDQTGWNISRTAAILNISRNTVRARMEKLGLREGPAAAVKRDTRAPSVAPPGSGAAPERSRARTGDRAPRCPRVRWEQRRIALMRVVLMVPETGDVLSDVAPGARDADREGRRASADGWRRSGSARWRPPSAWSPSRTRRGARLTPRWRCSAPSSGSAGMPSAPAHHPDRHPRRAGPGGPGGTRRSRSTRRRRRRGAVVLDDLIAAAEPGGILASAAAGALLERRFELVAARRDPTDPRPRSASSDAKDRG